MQPFGQNQSPNSPQLLSEGTEGIDYLSNFSQDRVTESESICNFDDRKDNESSTLRIPENRRNKQRKGDCSFYSQCDQRKLSESLNDELILERKVQRRDIIFRTKHFKESWVKHFKEAMFGFLKQPSDFAFSLAINRLKFYPQQSPFQTRFSKTGQEQADKQNSSSNSNDSQFRKTIYSTTGTTYSQQDLKVEVENLSVQNLLRSMFYDNEHQFMIYSFDYVFCHLTFITAMLYFWTRLDSLISNESPIFSRSLHPLPQRSCSFEQPKFSEDAFYSKINIFKTLKFYITERSQSLNICQINILIVNFFLNYLKSEFFDQNIVKEIGETQDDFINSLKLFRRIKRMENEFNSTSNQVVFESQLHKYEYENKLIESMQKTFLIFQFLNTHNFVSSPLQRYYELYEFQNSKKYYHLKRDHFCLWVMNIILHLCEKKSAESISKSAYYVITFLGILKKFKQNQNFEGISMILPILYNIKQQLPKVWNHAASRRKEINEKLKEYSLLLNKKTYKKQEIPYSCNAIISEDVIFEMCIKFQKYAKIDKGDLQNTVNVQKHRKFYNEFLVHIVFHKKEITQEYADEIEDYKREKQIGISFNMYLIDTYVCKSYKAANTKILWSELTQKSKLINQQINYNLYIDLIDYCFVGSTMKYKQLDI